MSRILYSLQALLLFALLDPIVCPSGEMISARRNRSSYIENSELDNLDDFTENKTNEHNLRKSQQQMQLRQQPAESRKSMESSRINDTILSIFTVGSEPGLKLFNNTLEPHSKFIDHMQADESFIDKSSNQEQTFKVQRTPDGKLNLVFNDFLFFQKTTETSYLRKESNAGGPIYFPDRYPTAIRHSAHFEPECEDDITPGRRRTFCNKVRNYPSQAKLQELLQSRFSHFEMFFGEDSPPLPENITQRMNSEPNEEYLCASAERVIYPQSGETKDAERLTIVNNDIYKQGVRIEECLTEDQPCAFMDSLPNHYRATCKQNYIYRSLVAIKNNEKITTDQFKIPSCCKCVLRHVRLH